MHHLHPLFINFLWETRPPTLRVSKLPSWALAKMKILPQHVYLKLGGKNYTQIWDKNQYEFGKKLAKNTPFASISPEDPTPPPPLVRR